MTHLGAGADPAWLGLSISLSQVLPLLANRLTPRQIALSWLLTALAAWRLALLIVCPAWTCCLLAAFGSQPVPPPAPFCERHGARLWPGIFKMCLPSAPFNR